MRMYSMIVFLAWILCAGTGCTGRVAALEDSWNLKHAILAQDLLEMGETQEDLERANSEYVIRLGQMDEEITALKAEVERLRMLEQPLLVISESVRAEVPPGLSVNASPATSGVNIVSMDALPTPVSAGSAEFAASASSVGPAESVEKATVAALPKKKKQGTCTGYSQALELLRKNKPGQARQLLMKYKKACPNSPLMPNVFYWLGETYFDEDQMVNAILAFKDVPETYPKHAKAPDALFKIIACYMQLDDRRNAAFYKGILLREYADSSAARLAKKRFPDVLSNQ